MKAGKFIGRVREECRLVGELREFLCLRVRLIGEFWGVGLRDCMIGEDEG